MIPIDMLKKILIGQSYEEARILIEIRGWYLRPTKKNGKSLAGTTDVNSKRINVEVDLGIITDVRGIG